MASRSFSRALRSPLSRHLTSPAVQRRTLISASQYARSSITAQLKPAVGSALQQSRGLKTIDFAGTKETVYGKCILGKLRSSTELTGLQSVKIGQGKSFW